MQQKPYINYAKKTHRQRAWDIFSLYIRRKAADKQGIVTCYTCGAKGKWVGDNFQAGHVLPGRGGHVLLNRDLVRVQCHTCNMIKGGNYEVFREKWIKENSQKAYEYHKMHSWFPYKKTEYEWKEEEKRYRKLLGAIQDKNPL